MRKKRVTRGIFFTFEKVEIFLQNEKKKKSFYNFITFEKKGWYFYKIKKKEIVFLNFWVFFHEIWILVHKHGRGEAFILPSMSWCAVLLVQRASLARAVRKPCCTTSPTRPRPLVMMMNEWVNEWIIWMRKKGSLNLMKISTTEVERE